MDFHKFIHLLYSRSLYFCGINFFDDKFEGVLGTNESCESIRRNYVKKIREDNPSFTEEQINGIVDLDTQANQVLNKSRFITSWHHNTCESEAMWKLYSKDLSSAVAIVTTAKKLKEVIHVGRYQPDKGSTITIDVGKIIYYDLNDLSLQPKMQFTHWYKRKSLEYENEVRAVYFNQRLEGQRGVLIGVDLSKLIDRVYISPFAPEYFRQLVIDITAKYGFSFPISYSPEKQAIPWK